MPETTVDGAAMATGALLRGAGPVCGDGGTTLTRVKKTRGREDACTHHVAGKERRGGHRVAIDDDEEGAGPVGGDGGTQLETTRGREDAWNTTRAGRASSFVRSFRPRRSRAGPLPHHAVAATASGGEPATGSRRAAQLTIVLASRRGRRPEY